MLEGSHYHKAFLDERPTLQALLDILARLEAQFRRYYFAGIFSREKTTLLGQILSAQGKTQLGLRLRAF
jgi:hypothetical protein